MKTSDKTRGAFTRACIVLAAGLLLVVALFSAHHFYKVSIQVRQAGYIDTPTFIMQAQYFLLAGELYRHPLKPGGEMDGYGPSSPWYKFPPAYMLAFMPWVTPVNTAEDIGKNVDAQARKIWIVHVFRYLGSLILLLLLLKGSASPWFILHGLAMGLTFTPFFESLYGLIFDNVLLFLLALILFLNKAGKNRLAGWCIGLAAMLKVYPAILILWAIAVKDWKIVLGAIAAAMLLLSGSLLVFGVENHLFYYTRLLPLLLQESSLVAKEGNFSLGAQFVGLWQETGTAMLWFSIYKNLMMAATISLLLYGKVYDNCFRFAAMKLSLIACMTILYLPNYWGNYQLVLILPVLTLLGNAYASSRGWFWQGAASMACWFVMIFSVDGGGQYVPLFSLAPPGWIKEIAGYRPYVPLALWVAEALALLTYRPINRVN